MRRLITGWDNELTLTSSFDRFSSLSVWSARWRGAVCLHPGAGPARHGGHCALRLWPALQPASWSSFPMCQATLWSEIGCARRRFNPVGLMGRRWWTLLVSLPLNSVSSMFSCHLWKTSDTSRFLLWTTTKSLPRQVPSPVSLWLHHFRSNLGLMSKIVTRQ